MTFRVRSARLSWRLTVVLATITMIGMAGPQVDAGARLPQPVGAAGDQIGIQDLEGTFYLLNPRSGLCLEVPNASRADGVWLRQGYCDFTPGGGLHQQFAFGIVGFNRIQMIAAHSWKCVDVFNESHQDGAVLIQWPCISGAPNQIWERFPAGRPLEYTYHAVHSGKCMEVFDWRTNPGARIVQWTCHGGANQIWVKLRP